MSEENNKLICQICGKVCFDFRGLGIHLGKIHNFDKKEYYGLYLKKDENEHLCKRCKKNPVRFISLKKGYADCCIKCSPLKIKETKFKNHGDENYTNRKQAKETCLDKYGVEYASQIKERGSEVSITWKNKTKEELEIRQLRSKQTCLNRYGVEYASQSPEFQEKVKNTSLKKYGYDHFLKALGILYNKKFSKISQELFWEIYKQLPEELYQKCYFAELNKERFVNLRGNYFLYDFCLLSKKLFIEFQGDYWHRNPKFYEATEENLKIWKKDEFKKQVAEEQGFQIFYIWESEYKENKEEAIQKCLQFLIFN